MIPTEEMIARGVAFALQAKIDKDYGWSEYVRDLYMRMQSASPHAVDMPLPHPTEAMIEAAEESYMPFGDMGFALMAAYAVAPADPAAQDVAGLVEALDLLLRIHDLSGSPEGEVTRLARTALAAHQKRETGHDD